MILMFLYGLIVGGIEKDANMEIWGIYMGVVLLGPLWCTVAFKLNLQINVFNYT